MARRIRLCTSHANCIIESTAVLVVTVSRNQLRRLPLSLLSSAGQWTVRQWRRGGDAPIGKPRGIHTRSEVVRSAQLLVYCKVRFLTLGAGKTSRHGRAKAFYRPLGMDLDTVLGRKTKRPGSMNHHVRWLKVKRQPSLISHDTAFCFHHKPASAELISPETN